MITRIVIPQGFENMEEATIGAWLRREGDSIARGDRLCELITEKTTFDLESEGEGELLRIVAPEKSVVPVGFIIALLGEAGDELPDADQENRALLERKSRATETSLNIPATAPRASSPTPQAASAGTRVRATPAARRAARDQGVAIEDVAAAFPGKVIGEDDVLKFVTGQSA